MLSKKSAWSQRSLRFGHQQCHDLRGDSRVYEGVTRRGTTNWIVPRSGEKHGFDSPRGFGIDYQPDFHTILGGGGLKPSDALRVAFVFRRMFGQHRVSFRRVLDYRVDESTDESPRQVARGGQSASSLLILLALQDP
jgi:hypothetical protein